MIRTAGVLTLLTALTGSFAGCANEAPPGTVDDDLGFDAGVEADGGEDAGEGPDGGDLDAGVDAPPAPTRPAEPASNDPTFVIRGAPRYVLAGDELTAATASFTLRVTAPAGVAAVDLWLDSAGVVPLTRTGGEFTATVDAGALAVGEHRLLLAERGKPTGFYRASFSKGHALYVIISTDWDFPDVDDRVLEQHRTLHQAHPELRITHLIGPYTFTDAAVTPARRTHIVNFARTLRDSYGDEIGLHVHPRCSFVQAAGLTCLDRPSFSRLDGASTPDSTGYTVRLGAYTRAQWNVLFAKALDIFRVAGLGVPTSFRAGGWTLELPTARALADAGFVVDSSAVPWQYMEEWEGYDLYSWNMLQWSPIEATSQPYYPTADRLLPGGGGAPLTLLEVPDNGIMVDYWTVDEMKGVFAANWSGGALAAPTQVSTGFHPAPSAYYDPAEYGRLDAFFSHVEQYLASSLSGPVKYINMSDAAKVWPRR